jgi:hypothetical protein
MPYAGAASLAELFTFVTASRPLYWAMREQSLFLPQAIQF